MNTEKPNRVKVCSCGAQFEIETRGQRSCPKCIEAKKAYQANHPRPIRQCEACGVESRECDHGKCPACKEAQRQQWKRDSTLLGEYWHTRQYVMQEVELAKEKNWGEATNDALALAINSMFLDLMKASRKAHAGEMEIHLLTIACQEGKVTPAQCNDMLDNHKIGTPGWNAIVERVYFDFFGRVLERKNAAQMTVDIEALKKMDRHPYMGNRGQALLHAYNKRHAHHKGRRGIPLTSTDHDWKPKEEAGQSDESNNRLRKWLDESLAETDNAYGGRYGYGAQLPRKPKQVEEAIDPEQVAHANQARIDSDFRDLMAGVL